MPAWRPALIPPPRTARIGPPLQSSSQKRDRRDTKELDPAELKRIRERDVNLRAMRYLAQVDIDPAAPQKRWGAQEAVRDHLAEWGCFAFPSTGEEVFFLQREVNQAPSHEFILSVAKHLFSGISAGQIVKALGVPGARVTERFQR
ncbi:hypothetical protein ABT330_34605 [Streptomyces sp. NPDC000658]|uniref:hypothetical protein n=1 Tax=Streptomyces sp. NPDC000658 TaxID=3154266 RepID=UPI003319DD8C